jgi:hypothetical protein
MWKSSNKKRWSRAFDHCLLSHKTNVFKVKPQCNNYAFVLPRNLEYSEYIKFVIPWKLSCHETFFNKEKKKTKLWLFVWWCWELKPTKKRKEIWKLGDLSFNFWNNSPNTCKSSRCDLLTRKTKYYFIFNTKHTKF